MQIRRLGEGCGDMCEDLRGEIDDTYCVGTDPGRPRVRMRSRRLVTSLTKTIQKWVRTL